MIINMLLFFMTIRKRKKSHLMNSQLIKVLKEAILYKEVHRLKEGLNQAKDHQRCLHYQFQNLHLQ